MQDEEIIALFFARNEHAIAETRKKYGTYCRHIAMNIVMDEGEAEECTSDAYFALWNTIPPEHPRHFAAYLAKITRNLAFNRYRSKAAARRGKHEIPLVLDELSDLASSDDVEITVDSRALSAEISAFLRELSKEKRVIFLSRYWYAKSVRDIAREMHMSEAGISMTLMRLRKKLGERLSERGFSL